jgi:hypothetical protein
MSIVHTHALIIKKSATEFDLIGGRLIVRWMDHRRKVDRMYDRLIWFIFCDRARGIILGA